MTCRECCRENLGRCLAIEPRHLGDERVGSKQARLNWCELIQRRGFNSIVLEDETPQGRRPIACGASVFVTKEFADQELRYPRIGLVSRLIQSLSTPHPAVLSDYEVVHADATRPMDVAMLQGSWLQNLRPEQEEQLRLLLPFSFVEFHTGYPINRVFNETVTQIQHDFQFSAGVFHLLKSYPAQERSLLMMDETSARSVSGSIATKLYRYQAPVLSLRDTEKHLLSEALNGGDDQEIAVRAHLAVVSVKKRWQSVFERFESAIPGLLQEASPERAGNHRGSQKRHHVLSYIRHHPEEVRPYRWIPDVVKTQ
jgi:hypothetical protein